MDEAKTGKKSLKKRLIIIGIIVVFLILLIPFPFRYKDGGSVEYKAILYSYKRYNAIMSPTYRDGMAYETTLRGSTLSILGISVYDGTFTDVAEEGRPIKQSEFDSGRVTPTPTLTPAATATPTSTPSPTPSPEPTSTPIPTSTPVPDVPAPQEDSYAYRGQYDYSRPQERYSQLPSLSYFTYNRKVEYFDSNSELIRERYLLDDKEIMFIDYVDSHYYTEKIQGSEEHYTECYRPYAEDPKPLEEYTLDEHDNAIGIKGNSSKSISYHKGDDGRLDEWTLTENGISQTFGVRYYSDGVVMFYPKELTERSDDPFDTVQAVVFLPGETFRAELLGTQGLNLMDVAWVEYLDYVTPPVTYGFYSFFFESNTSSSEDGSKSPTDKLLYLGQVNKADLLQDKWVYPEEGHLDNNHTEYRYDGDKLIYYWNGDGGGHSSESYKYDKNGRVIESVFDGDMGRSNTCRYTYNDAGKIVSSTKEYEWYHGEGYVKGSVTYKYSYDGNGVLTGGKCEGKETKSYSYDDRPDEVTTYTYRLAPYKGNGSD